MAHELGGERRSVVQCDEPAAVGEQRLAHACSPVSNATGVSCSTRTHVTLLRELLGAIPAAHSPAGLEQALAIADDALSIDRRSRPSLLMHGTELDDALRHYYPKEARATDFRATLVATTA